MCVPESHLNHRKFFQKKKMLDRKEDWYAVEEKDKFQLPLKNFIKLDNEEGDFILWDSRTFHCNTVPKVSTLRACVYVCMIPTEKVPDAILKKRKKAAEDRRTSTHQPGDGFRLFPTLPRFVNNRDHFL